MFSAHLLLGHNVFKGATPEESRKNIIRMPLPDFRKLDQRIDKRLNEILQRCLARDLSQRYSVADDLLYDLEHYIYHSGYGPTNETMGKLMRELFEQNGTEAPQGGGAILHDVPHSQASR